MTFKYRALTLGCFAAFGLAGAAHSVELAGGALEVYGNLYPQYQSTSVTGGTTSISSTATSMGKVTYAAQPDKTQITPVGSYVGFKGKKAFGETQVGFDIQGVVNIQKTAGAFLSEPRDAYVYISNKTLGKFTAGQMDTVYKSYGDRNRMLGVASSNFVSTSGILSDITWKKASGSGSSSFHTRTENQVSYETPVFNGVQGAISTTIDQDADQASSKTIGAKAIRWSNKEFYVSVQEENHNDFRLLSTALTNSKDTGKRLSLGYKKGPWNLATDFSTLQYTQSGLTGSAVNSYKTNTMQVTAEYAVNSNIRLAVNTVRGDAGSCSKADGSACLTTGLGGSAVNFGAMYSFDKNISVFALVGSASANENAFFASKAIASTNFGGTVKNMAVGIQAKF
jgi:predicted porin